MKPTDSDSQRIPSEEENKVGVEKGNFLSEPIDDIPDHDAGLSEEERAEHVSSEPFLNVWLRRKNTDAFKL
jgi:hypothetical protein